MMESFSNRRFLSPELKETVYEPSYIPPTHVESVLKKAHHHISPLLIILVAILGGCFLVVSYYAIIVKFCSNLNNSRRPQQPQNEENDADDTLREDFLDENHGPVLDHPIWYIRTVGLAQTIIDSIAVVKYKKGEGLIEGTDCSICLSEFEEDETLRLLPKCSHAFHLSCIDTWLAAHTNCPSCRAPVVANSSLVPAPTSGVGQETTQVGNSENDGGLESELNGEDEVSDLSVRVQDEREEQERRGVEISKKDLLSPLEMSGFRVCSDLSDNHRVAQNGRQPVRRSASMDVNPASIFCFSGANSLPLDEEEKEDEGPSVVQLEKGKKANLSAGLPRLTGSSSNGKLFPKCPSIKRSFSSGGKLVSSRSSRNRSSILPL